MPHAHGRKICYRIESNTLRASAMLRPAFTMKICYRIERNAWCHGLSTALGEPEDLL